MSDKPARSRPVSRLVNATSRMPPVVVDCSDRDPDVPADPRPGSRLVNATQSMPPVEVDCSDWEPDIPAAWLELRGPADPGAVEAATARLVRAADAAAPELGLTLDPGRSGVEGGEVVVALTPTRPVGGADRLEEIARTLAASQIRAAWRRAG